MSGIANYDLIADGDWVENEPVLEGTSATSYRFNGTNYRGDCGDGAIINYYVVAHDNRGNSAKSRYVDRYPDVWQENGYEPSNSTAVRLTTRTGTWSTSNCTCFNGGHTLYSTASSAALSYTVTTTAPGQTVALVMEKNTNRGKVNISVDGAAATSVDTRADAATHRVIVWQKALSAPGTHTLKVSNAATSGRTRVDVDSIMLTH